MENEYGWQWNGSYTTLPTPFFERVKPTPVRKPEIVVFNNVLAEQLGLDGEQMQTEGVGLLAGNAIPTNTEPIAQAYAGHQFGHFTMLGDGRAILLGEHRTPDGKQYDIQLKGAGLTRYSRGGDGRATLGPMLREYIISEAMHALGIPTTRSLAVVKTGERVFRKEAMAGAILTRVARSHLRVGTFEFARAYRTTDELRALADYAIVQLGVEVQNGGTRYQQLLDTVIERQTSLIAQWQLVGFVHGVMNTDNMTISGETIDYGPCAFLDVYDRNTVFSSIDSTGRYAYGNQPGIGAWNVARLAEALLPLLAEDEDEALQIAQQAIDSFLPRYHQKWLKGMRGKLGLNTEVEQDEALIVELLTIMEAHKADYTQTFVALTEGDVTFPFFETASFVDWRKAYDERLIQEAVSLSERQNRMRRVNPVVIPRNHRVEEALEAAVEGNDYSLFESLLQAVQQPFQAQQGYTEPSTCTTPYRTYCGT
ncbi:MAG: protein adenylyltransferase SelO [Bacilli bacterium]